jgi:tripeptide aminopeptidase
MTTTFHPIPLTRDEVRQRAVTNLLRAVRFDTQSDEAREAIPSSRGQIDLIDDLRRFFTDLGLVSVVDPHYNLIVTIPATPGHPDTPPITLMAHVDTSTGTRAIERCCEVTAWTGEPLIFPANPALCVDPTRFPHISGLIGHTILHGPGVAPFGLDNKAGLAEIMTLAEILVIDPTIPHGEIILGFRPDEEIGRHTAVTTLAATLAERGVRYGWTVDGSTPFEINTSNFYATRADVVLPIEPLNLPPCPFAQELTIEIIGVDTHGATAAEEGYLNAAVVFARIFERLDLTQGILPVDFDRTTGKETTGILKVIVIGDEAATVAAGIKRLLTALELEIREHRWKGARFTVLETRSIDLSGGPETPRFDDGACAVAVHLSAFLQHSWVSPLLAEESTGNQGYSNPHWISRTPAGMIVRYRLRDFAPELLEKRGRDLERLCQQYGGAVTITPQYIDMGPALRAEPELLQAPLRAFAPLTGTAPFVAQESPIRGGTGVDAFTEKGVLIGNIGAGYFFLESAKELTSRELLGLHVEWLVNLVQTIAPR